MGEYTGGGELVAVSRYTSSAQWNTADTTQVGYVVSDDTGFLGQNRHDDGNVGGVWEVDLKHSFCVHGSLVYDMITT